MLVPARKDISKQAHKAVLLSDAEIRRQVRAPIYLSGRQYLAEGRLRDVKFAADGETIIAHVQGGARAPYSVVVRVSTDRRGEVKISSSCSCPVGTGCKHVAAVLLSVLPGSAGAAGPAGGDAAPPDEVALWLQALQTEAAETDSDDHAAKSRHRLVYLLQPGRARGSLQVDASSVELRADGKRSARFTRHNPRDLMFNRQPPGYLRPVDLGILRRLVSLGLTPDDEFIETLRRILATGRAFWETPQGRELREGPAITGAFGWHEAEDGSQRPELKLPQGLLALHFAQPWYADVAAGQLGPITLAMPPRLVQTLLAAPAVPPEHIREIGAELVRRVPGLPAPREVPLPPLIEGPVTPVLSLIAATIPPDPVRAAQLAALQRRANRRSTAVPEPKAQVIPLARLTFRYGDFSFPAGKTAAGEPAKPGVQVIDGVAYRVRRDQVGEAAAMAQLRRRNFTAARTTVSGTLPAALRDTLTLGDDGSEAWIDFMLEDRPALEAAGWTINVSDDFPIRFATLTGDITAEIVEGSGIDWFDLELGGIVDGERVNLLPALLELIRNERAAGFADDDDEYADDEDDHPAWTFAKAKPADPAATDEPATAIVPLPDGRILELPIERLRPLLNIILELFEGGDDGPLRLPRHRLADLALVEDAGGVVWRGGEALRALGRMLRATEGIPACRLPASFAAALRPYQQRGVDWLQFLGHAGLGGVLADEMGLGKTIQTLAHLAIEQAEGRLHRPALVVCPTSLVANWCNEAARFAPSLRVLALHGPGRRAHFESVGAHDVVVTTYPLLSRDQAVMERQEWHVVILDEAQTIKNPQANTTKLAAGLRGRQRLCLTGTPLENHLGELWSLFHFLMPGFLGDTRSFGRNWRGPIEREGSQDRRLLLSRRITPFLLRRTKADVAADLPPKSEIIEPIEMEAAQRAVYEGIRLTMHAKVKQAVAARGLSRSGIIILDALLKLRQACCDPRLLKLKSATAFRAKSAKLERLMVMLPELLEEGRRVLLFSQFTSMLELIEAELEQAKIPYVILTGETRDRATPLRQFSTGACPLFLISLKAGGVGLNLTAADTVIHYDPWWNPAVEAQATDRAHRIGQTRPVFVYRLITGGTIEEKMETLKARKQALVAGILGEGDGRTLALTEEDIEQLFAPLLGK